MPDGYSYVSSGVPAGDGCASATVSVPISNTAGTPLAPNTRYRAKAVADSTSGSVGGRTLSAEFFFTTKTTCGTDGAPPVVGAATASFQEAATSPTTGAMLLTANVHPNGQPCSYVFEVATDAAFTSIAASTPAQSIATPGCVSAPVTATIACRAAPAAGELAHNTVYFARCRATNTGIGGGATTGAASAQFFSAGQPTATTKAADAITATGATLHGTDRNFGTPSTWFYEYAINSYYTNNGSTYNQTTAQASHSANAAGQPCDKAITGLTSGSKTYHYRLRVNRQDGGGSAIGADMTFVTL